MTTPFVHDLSLEIGTVFGLPVYWYGAIYTVGSLGVLGWFALRRGRLGSISSATTRAAGSASATASTST